MFFMALLFKQASLQPIRTLRSHRTLNMVRFCENHPACTHTVLVVELPRLIWCVCGIAGIVLATGMSRSSAIYYINGSIFGVLVATLMLVFSLARETNKRLSTAWATVVVAASSFFGFLGLQVLAISSTHDLLWLLSRVLLMDGTVLVSYAVYALLVGSFLVVYYHGPPSTRTQDVLEISYYIVGGLCIFFSIQDTKTGALIILLTAAMRFFLSRELSFPSSGLSTQEPKRSHASVPVKLWLLQQWTDFLLSREPDSTRDVPKVRGQAPSRASTLRWALRSFLLYLSRLIE